MKLEGTVALVTGASRGIGRAIALAFAQEGARVAVNYLRSGEEAKDVCRQINDLTHGIAVRADVSDLTHIDPLVDRVLEEFERIDILVNNAGIYRRNTFFESNGKTWDNVMGTNLKGPYFLAQRVAAHMVEQEAGNIVNISSVAGIKQKVKKGLEYGISKCALNYLTRSLSLILAEHGIRVNAIAPGYAATELTSYDEGAAAKKAAKVPLGKIVTPEEIAKLAVYLASDDSENMTGQIIALDGGMSCL